MRKPSGWIGTLCLLAFSAWTSAWTSDAFAHGGAYQPPPDDSPPFGDVPGEGGGPTTGGGGGGPTTGGGDPGGPTTGGDPPGGGDVGGPTTGGGPGKSPTPPSGPPPGGDAGGPVTGGGAPTPPPRKGRTASGPDPDHWTRWWYSHRINLVDLDARVDRNAANTPGGEGGSELWRADAQRALTLALSDRDEDVSSGAAIALGKSADPSDAPALTALVRDRTRQQPVREAAALGLALIGRSAHPSSEAATRALMDIVARDDEPERLRAIVTWSLGLRRDPLAVPFLLDLVTAKASSWDVPAAATSALGLSGNDLVREPLLEWLDGTPGRRRHETLRRVHAAHALAHLGDRSVVPALRDVLRDDDEDVRRSAVLALGALADRGDEETASVLIRLLDRDRDRGVRNMAALALGRIGPKSAERALRYAYAKSDGLSQPFAALALGLLARSTGDAGLTADLRKDLKDRANSDLRGALAIALGIARDRAAAKTLRTIAVDRGDPELRAHVALALGMIGDASSLEDLRAILADTRDPVLQRECAMALGLLGDVKSLAVLTKLVEDGSSLYVVGAAAMALGRIGGAEAGGTLTKLLADTSRPGLARGFAAVGLGYVLDRTAGRGLGRVGTHLDWYFRLPSTEEILTIL